MQGICDRYTIRWRDIVPSEGNPRKDFGDLEALARSISATGGQPVNPIIVVRDGEKYRIVDGERRWRAMGLLAPGGNTSVVMVDAICYDDASAAEEAVAMVATDDKRPLTPEEKARGFQSMLMLGVDDTTVSKATGVECERVRRARRISPDELPEQYTMDALLAAAEFDDPEERAQVLGSPSPTVTANAIRNRREQAEARAAIREAMDGRGLSVEYDEDHRPSPEWAHPEGLAFVMVVRTTKDVAALDDAHHDDELVAYASIKTWEVWKRVAEGELTDEDRRRNERAALRERSSATVAAFRRELIRLLAKRGEVGEYMSELVLGTRSEELTARRLGLAWNDDGGADGLEDGEADLLDSVLNSMPSLYEAVDVLSKHGGYGYGVRSWDGSYDESAAAWWSDVLQAANDDGLAGELGACFAGLALELRDWERES